MRYFIDLITRKIKQYISNNQICTNLNLTLPFLTEFLQRKSYDAPK